MGYYFCLIENVTHGKLFIGIYGVLATYFSSVMIRLMLTLAPAVCIIAAIALNEVFEKAGDSIRQSMVTLSMDPSETHTEHQKQPLKDKKDKKDKSKKEDHHQQ